MQLAEIKKRPKVHAAHVDLGEDDKDSVEDGGANGNENAGSDVSGDDVVSGGDDGGSAEEETDGITKLKEKYLRIQSRASPSVLQKVVEALDEVQRRVVVRIGFGSMLRIKLTELPAKLGFWVVEKFNPRSSSIELADGTKVHVTVDDIRHVLGLSCGCVKVLSKKKGEKCDILEQLRVEIGMRDNKISPLELSEKVLQYIDGGIWFVRLFLLLVVSVLVDSPSHGYVNNWVLKRLEDVDGIAQLNWCEYVHRALIGSRVKWEKGNRKYYIGPLLCLMVFYMDRVVLYSRDVERMSPAFLGWTSKILRDRENKEVRVGGFGLGYEDGRFVGEVMDVSSGDTVVEKGKVLATTIIDLVSLIESAPSGTMENDVFRQLQLAAGRLLGLAQRRGGGSLETPDGGFSEVTYDEGFWSDPANIEQLMANARSKYKKIMEDMPSFSLGFSQLDVENENVNIDGGDIGACKNTPSTPAVRVVNEPESNPVVENVFITPGEVHYRVGDAVDRDLAGGSRNQPDKIEMTAVAGVSAVGDGTVPGTDPEVKQYNAARKFARSIKPVGPLRSPYLTRPIDPSDGLSVLEKRVTNWVLQIPNAPKDEAFFVKDGFELTRGEIASLDIGEHISKRVIDVWSIILNHNEKFRSEESPLRVFARSMDCVANGDIVDVSEANVKNMFANALLPAWDDMADDFNWGKAKLRITFPWRDPKATFDYSVETMRHMETYMGDGGKGWNSGLSRLNLKPMLLLRCKYCACILLSPVNALLDKVYEESEKLERERKEKDPK
ncbi:unnamed protein product [Cuscuta campestris]|uniref:Aminotransferase-like plant mobile domain-containing protein n=1 Tax=Cuscuta campestris TaxID=132261 RepID=A0A484LTI4_9ASTE|nr:unnamed protein product [Cuscuta campestris]